MKYKLILFLFTSFLHNSSCGKQDFSPGRLDTINGSYHADLIKIETPKETISLNLVLHFDNNGENGSYKARLTTKSDLNQIALDLGGEISNLSKKPNSQIELEQIVLINLEDYMVIDVMGELNQEAGGIDSKILINYGDYNDAHQIVFRPHY